MDALNQKVRNARFLGTSHPSGKQHKQAAIKKDNPGILPD
jgi:hypothetical protein